MATASASSPVSAAGGSDARLASTPPPQAGSAAGVAPAVSACSRAADETPLVYSVSRGRACWRMLATSRADSRAFTPTCQAPARLQANSDTTMAARFSPTSMTRSPRATPLAGQPGRGLLRALPQLAVADHAAAFFVQADGVGLALRLPGKDVVDAVGESE